METHAELRHYGNRLPYYAFFVEHFGKVNAMQARHNRRAIWTEGRVRRFWRIKLTLERNWDELRAIGLATEAALHDSSEVRRYFEQAHSLLQAMADMVNGFDEVTRAMLEKHVSSTH